MIDDTKISNRQEHELSMDEILSSIRNIITEDQEVKSENRRTFPQDSTTNPSGARMMEDLPKFDQEDEFVLPNFKEEKQFTKRGDSYASERSIFPDEDFNIQHQNERSLRDQADPYYEAERFSRDAHSTEDRISKALKNIVESYGQRKHAPQMESVNKTEQNVNLNRFTEVLQPLIERIMTARIEEWLNKHLPEMIEKAILRELERVANQIRF